MGIEVRMVYNHFGKIRAETKPNAKRAIKKAGFDMVAGAQERSRVDSGAMKDAWQFEMESELVGVVFNTVEHSIYNEFGTYKMAAQPMIRPAVEQVGPSFEAAMRQIVG